MSGTKRKSVFLDAESTQKRKPISEPIYSRSIIKVKPSPGHDLTRDKTITFVYKTGTDPCKFMRNAFGFKFRLTVPDDSDDPVSFQNTEWYLASELGAASFIAGVDVSFNNTMIASIQNPGFNFYQVLNRMHASNDEKERLGTLDRPHTNLQNNKKNMASRIKKLQCGAAQGGHKLIITGNCDGIPFVSDAQCLAANTLASSGTALTASIVPPGTEVAIRVRLHPRLTERFVRAEFVPSNFFLTEKPKNTEVALSAAFAKEELPTGLEVELEDAWVQMEQVRHVNRSVSRELQIQPLTFHYDEPVFSIVSVGSGLQYFSSTHYIPKHTAICFIAFPMSFQVFGDSVAKRPGMANVFSCPKNLCGLRFLLDDQPIEIPQGLNWDPNKSFESSDIAIYKDYLKQQGLSTLGLLDTDYAGETTFDFCFSLNMSEYDLKTAGKLGIEMRYGSNLSTEGRVCMVISVVQSAVKKNKDGMWSKASV